MVYLIFRLLVRQDPYDRMNSFVWKECAANHQIVVRAETCQKFAIVIYFTETMVTHYIRHVDIVINFSVAISHDYENLFGCLISGNFKLFVEVILVFFG